MHWVKFYFGPANLSSASWSHLYIKSFSHKWRKLSCLIERRVYVSQFSLLSLRKWGNGPCELKLWEVFTAVMSKKLLKIEVTLQSLVAPLNHCWYWSNILKYEVLWNELFWPCLVILVYQIFRNLSAIYHFKDDDRDAAKVVSQKSQILLDLIFL